MGLSQVSLQKLKAGQNYEKKKKKTGRNAKIFSQDNFP